MINALHSLLNVFNLQSFIGLPGHSDASDSESTARSLLTILVIGLMAEVMRRSLDTQYIFAYLSELFYITVSFDEHDPCYGVLDFFHFFIFFLIVKKNQSGSSLGYLSNRNGVSQIFLFSLFILRFFVETIRTASISTTVTGEHSGHPRHGGPFGLGSPTPQSMNPTQMIYTIPEIEKTYWMRTSQGYWVSICRKRQDAT